MGCGTGVPTSLKRMFQLGRRDYAVGYSPMFEAVKCLGRIAQPPIVLGAAAHWFGYCVGSLKRQPRLVPPHIVTYIRNEQSRRVRGVARSLNPGRLPRL